MQKAIKKSEKTGAEKKISFSDGLKIVQAIQKKVKDLERTRSSTRSSNEYSF